VLLEERDSIGWVLKALREAGNSILVEFHGLDEQMLGRRPNDDEWCLKEIAAHMRDAEELSLLQMMTILEDARQSLPVWDVDALPSERDYRAADLGDLLSELHRLRRETTQLLWSIANRDWRVKAQHRYRGEISLEDIARELAQHDLEHLWQVRRLKHQLGAKVHVSGDDDVWR
jgi:hypothetical protein